MDEDVKEARLAQLQAVLSAAQASFNRQALDRDIEVLFERPGRRPGQLLGRSPHNQAVHVEASDGLMGALAGVRVRQAKAHSLEGMLVDGTPGTRACA